MLYLKRKKNPSFVFVIILKTFEKLSKLERCCGT